MYTDQLNGGYMYSSFCLFKPNISFCNRGDRTLYHVDLEKVRSGRETEKPPEVGKKLYASVAPTRMLSMAIQRGLAEPIAPSRCQCWLQSSCRPQAKKAPKESLKMLHMSSSFCWLGVESLDCSQAVKESTARKAEAIDKMTTSFTQKEDIGPF